MLARGKSPQGPARPGRVLLALAGLLLPLLPGAGQTQAPPARLTPARRPAGDLEKLLASKVCMECHAVKPAREAGKEGWKHEHDEVVRLVQQLAEQRARVRDTEKALSATLAELERAQAAAARKDEARKRLTELDRKLEGLQEELDRLRRELRPEDAGPGRKTALARADHPPGTMFINKRAFHLPVRIDEREKGRVQKVLLYRSADGGTSWQLQGQLPADKDHFDIKVERDGTYLFAIRVVKAGGAEEPAPRGPEGALLRLCVDTVRPVAVLKAVADPGGALKVAWQVQDDNLDLSSLVLEYRSVGDGPWLPLSVRPAAEGVVTLPPGHPGRTEVRIRVADLAGNVADGSGVVQPAP